MGTLHEVLCTIMITSSSVLLRMRIVSDKSFMSNHVFPKKCDVYDMIWKNMAQPDRLQMTIQHMHF
jgi:hypothetical protein